MFSIPGVPNPTPSQIEEFLIAQIQQECSVLIARQEQLAFGPGGPDHAAIHDLLTNAQVYFRTYDKVAATLSALGQKNLAVKLEQVQGDLRSALAKQQELILGAQKSQADLEKWLADQTAQADKDLKQAVDADNERVAAAIRQLIDLNG